MKVIEKIYRKEMILMSLKSFCRTKENKNYLMALCNLDTDFLHGCVRSYRGKLSISKRIARIKSGNKIY